MLCFFGCNLIKGGFKHSNETVNTDKDEIDSTKYFLKGNSGIETNVIMVNGMRGDKSTQIGDSCENLLNESQYCTKSDKPLDQIAQLNFLIQQFELELEDLNVSNSYS